jgi:hypothetical protein
MHQNKTKTTLCVAEDSSVAGELIHSALRRNPAIAVAASLAGSLLSLFRGRRRKAEADVRKIKLESYSYSPVGCGRSVKAEELERSSNGARTHLEHKKRRKPASSVRTSRRATVAKGGL